MINKFHATFLALIFSATVWIQSAGAQEFDYALTPQKIADNVYFFEGLNEDFTFQNGGNIVNVGVIVTSDGVVLINAGPSLMYGQQLRKAVAKISSQPIIGIYISKLHPDHYLGVQAFKNIPVYTLAKTRELINQFGDQFTDNMYRLVGSWMKGTDGSGPTHTVKPGTMNVGGRTLEIFGDSGHTPSDLMLLDRKSGALFAGGVVFHDRAPTTPNADLKKWKQELKALEKIKFNYLIPSHGPVADNDYPVKQTYAYVDWLDQHFTNAAAKGVSMAEVLFSRLPPEFTELAVMPTEYHRSVSHLYSGYEAAELPLLSEGNY